MDAKSKRSVKSVGTEHNQDSEVSALGFLFIDQNLHCSLF